MHRLATRLAVAAIVGLLASCLTPLRTPLTAHAATCGANATIAGNITPTGTFDTPAGVVAAFDAARAQEGCLVPLSINVATFGSETPQQQMLDLFNAERQDRGIAPLRLDPVLLSQIALNHSHEQFQYNYLSHSSPINHAGVYTNTITDRLAINAAVAGRWTAVGENAGSGIKTSAEMVYWYMYEDAGSGWGHRKNILGWTGSSFGRWDWVGIGVWPLAGNQYGTQYTSAFLQDSSTAPYVPPAGTDVVAPVLTPPTVISGSLSSGGTLTVQTNHVGDAGASAGEAGVTNVVFYANQLTMTTGGATNAVQAIETGSGTWAAVLTGVPAGATIHAVAVDGSGNYTDCSATSGSCGSLPAGATVTLTPATAAPGLSLTVAGTGFTPNETVNLYADPSSSSAPVTQLTADGSGSVSWSTSLGATIYGPHTVILLGASSGLSANATLLIRPDAFLTSPSAAPASVDYLGGFGFSPGETVTVRLGSPTGTALAWRGSDSSGTAYPIKFTVPALAPGNYTVYATGSFGHMATTTITIT